MRITDSNKKITRSRSESSSPVKKKRTKSDLGDNQQSISSFFDPRNLKSSSKATNFPIKKSVFLNDSTEPTKKRSRSIKKTEVIDLISSSQSHDEEDEKVVIELDNSDDEGEEQEEEKPKNHGSKGKQRATDATIKEDEEIEIENILSDYDEFDDEGHKEDKVGNKDVNDDEIHCPICGRSLNGYKPLDKDLHVNKCLDDLTTRKNPNQNLFREEKEPEQQKPKKGSLRSISTTNNNVFKDLMSIEKSSSEYKNSIKSLAENSEPDPDLNQPGLIRTSKNKIVPFYKVLEGTNISVDAFKYGKIPNVDSYILTHAHSDHYTNLNSSWKNGLIYCSLTTANLIKLKLGIKDDWIRVLSENQSNFVEGVKVTLIDANHCPGACLFLFEGVNQKTLKPFVYLHCGDFRASPIQLNHPALKDKKIDICYLDTTYLNPKYCFPAQDQSIKACIKLIQSRISELKAIESSSDNNLIKKFKNNKVSNNKKVKKEENNVQSAKILKGWLCNTNNSDNSSKNHSTSSSSKVGISNGLLFEEDKESKKGLVEVVKKEEGSLETEELNRINEIDKLGDTGEDVKFEIKTGSEFQKTSSSLINYPQDQQSSTKSTFIKKENEKNRNRLLILVGTYSIGKEKILRDLANSINSKVYCNAKKSMIFKCMKVKKRKTKGIGKVDNEGKGDEQIHNEEEEEEELMKQLITNDPFEAQIHVTNLFCIKKEILNSYLKKFQGHFSHIIGLKPTGWSFSPKSTKAANSTKIHSELNPSIPKLIEDFQSSKDDDDDNVSLYPSWDSNEFCQIYGVPYSEHSSFYELTCFCISMDCERIVPTVNCGSPKSRAEMKYWFAKWKLERNRRVANGLNPFVEPRSDKYW